MDARKIHSFYKEGEIRRMTPRPEPLLTPLSYSMKHINKISGGIVSVVRGKPPAQSTNKINRTSPAGKCDYFQESYANTSDISTWFGVQIIHSPGPKELKLITTPSFTFSKPE